MTWWNPLTWFTDDEKAVVSETTDYDPRGACSDTGHAYEAGDRTHFGYFARRTPFSSRSKSTFKVYEKYWYECAKCGQTDHRKDSVGKVVVEDGEITDVR